MSKNQTITPRSEDYSKWYQDLIEAGDLAEHGPAKGTMIIKPYGYAIWENIQRIMNEKIAATGAKNAYFPMFIPQSFLNKEKEHVEGFAPELAIVTHGGGEELEEPLVVRPTSETIIYDTYSRWVQSYRDLPILINQWANVVRWEMRTRLFLRTTEFLWQEGHTVHETEAEAEIEARKMLEVYRDFSENYLAMPVITGRKPEHDKFPGALHTYCIEAMMQDRKSLQAGTSHHLGQNFAKAFNIVFTDKNSEKQFAWQTSWGVSTRLIGGLIMTHSDDKGLILPPEIAPIKVVIIPIYKTDEEKELVQKNIDNIKAALNLGLEIEVDYRDNLSPGFKFNEWEKKGVPLRVEIGPKDVANNQVVLVRRDSGDKKFILMTDLKTVVEAELLDMQNSLLAKAKDFRKDNTFIVDNYEELIKILAGDGGYVYSHWCGDAACEDKINAEVKAAIRCLPLEQKDEDGKCVVCGKKSERRVIFAKAY